MSLVAKTPLVFPYGGFVAHATRLLAGKRKAPRPKPRGPCLTVRPGVVRDPLGSKVLNPFGGPSRVSVTTWYSVPPPALRGIGIPCGTVELPFPPVGPVVGDGMDVAGGLTVGVRPRESLDTTVGR